MVWGQPPQLGVSTANGLHHAIAHTRSSSSIRRPVGCKRAAWVLPVLFLFALLVWCAILALPSPTKAAAAQGAGGVLQSSVEYWWSFWHDLGVRLGLKTAVNEALQGQDPVALLLQAAWLSEEESRQLQRQREDYYHDDSVRSVRVTLSISVPVFLLALATFEVLLRSRWGRAIAVPRLTAARDAARQRRQWRKDRFAPSHDPTILPGRLAPAAGLCGNGHVVAPPGFGEPLITARPSFSSHSPNWAQQVLKRQIRCRLAELLRVVLSLEESKILECAGMDALVMLRFCALCGRFCALSGVWCVLLVPLYSIGGNWWIVGPPQGFSRYSLSNLRHGSSLLWAVVPASYLCTLSLCGLLWKEYEHFVQLRRAFLSGEQHWKAFEAGQTDNELPAEFPWWRGLSEEALSLEFPWRRGLTPPQLPMNAQMGEDTDMMNAGHRNVSGIVRSVEREQARRTVLLERLPLELREPVALRACLEDLLGANTVYSVTFVPRDSRHLTDMLGERTRLLRDGSDLCALAVLEERLRLRREEFGRSMAAPRPHPKHTNSFLSVSDPAELPEGNLKAKATTWPTAVPSNGSAHGLPAASGDTIHFLESAAAGNRTPAWAIGWAVDTDEGEEGQRGLGRASVGEGTSAAGTTKSATARGRSWASTTSDDHKPHLPCSLSEMCVAAYLTLRTALGAVWGALAAVGAVSKEVVGASVRRVGLLVPASALGTPAPPSAVGTPFTAPCDMSKETPSHRWLPTVTVGDTRVPVHSSTAFVTFRTLQAACLACQVVLDEDAVVGSELVAEPAPEPRDVNWRNAARPIGQVLVRNFFVEVALTLGLAFWSVPVSLLQAWCSLDRLQKLMPWIQLPLHLLRTDYYALITLYLPVLALLGFLEVLPTLLHCLGQRYECVKSWSALQMMTMRRYWRFQLGTIVVTALASSIWDSLRNIVDHPASVLWQLGQSLPKAAVYFLATVLSSGLLMGPLTLLRPHVLLMQLGRMLRHKFWALLCACCRRRGRAPEPPKVVASELIDTPDLAADLSALLLVLLVCVTYATIAPLIMLAGLVFFVVRWGVLAVRYLYVHVPCFDSGGAFWYLLWDQALLALLLGNLTTLAVVGLRAGYAQFPFLLPLPLLPIGFKMRAEYRFAGPSRRLSLRWAKRLDSQDPRLSECFEPDAYWHPALRIPEGEYLACGRGERERGSLGAVAETRPDPAEWGGTPTHFR